MSAEKVEVAVGQWVQSTVEGHWSNGVVFVVTAVTSWGVKCERSMAPGSVIPMRLGWGDFRVLPVVGSK